MSLPRNKVGILNKEKIKAGIIGLGFIGSAHADAIKRLGYVDIAAACESDADVAAAKAESLSIGAVYDDASRILDDDEIQVVHVCTPNHLHYDVIKEAMKRGKHVFAEKPLGMNTKETGHLVELLEKYPVVTAVNFNYRMYPHVLYMKEQIASGKIGKPYLVHGSFLQDWLLYDTDYNWRLDKEQCGESRALADIGSHWCDLAQTVLSAKISEVFGDVKVVIPERKMSANKQETFQRPDGEIDYTPVKIDTEDYAAVLVRFDNGTSGVFHVSQVSAGRKCYLNIEVNGSESSMAWSQEDPERLWRGHRQQGNQILMRDPAYMSPEARAYSQLPVGHGEGWFDALRNNIESFYKHILEKKDPSTAPFASFKDGYNMVALVEAILESSKTRTWQKVVQI